jgi:hypothetical protein
MEWPILVWLSSSLRPIDAHRGWKSIVFSVDIDVLRQAGVDQPGEDAFIDVLRALI